LIELIELIKLIKLIGLIKLISWEVEVSGMIARRVLPNWGVRGAAGGVGK